MIESLELDGHLRVDVDPSASATINLSVKNEGVRLVESDEKGALRIRCISHCLFYAVVHLALSRISFFLILVFQPYPLVYPLPPPPPPPLSPPPYRRSPRHSWLHRGTQRLIGHLGLLLPCTSGDGRRNPKRLHCRLVPTKGTLSVCICERQAVSEDAGCK